MNKDIFVPCMPVHESYLFRVLSINLIGAARAGGKAPSWIAKSFTRPI